MLVVLFGPRWGILPALSIYLFSSITMPAFMWWAAALNQLPLQAVFFAAVTTWVLHLRSSSKRWFITTIVVLALGLTAYVKTLLVLPVLAVVMLGWFSSGNAMARIRYCVGRYRLAVVTLIIGPGLFLAYYLTAVPQVFRDSPAERHSVSDVVLPLADTMLVSSLTTGLTGGPWRWLSTNPPLGTADPPAIVLGLSWLLVLALAALLFITRRGTLPAWTLFVLYVLGDWFLVPTSRARIVGDYAGTEYRYLTDVVPVATQIGRAHV